MGGRTVNKKAIDSAKDKGPHTLADGQLSTNVGSTEHVELGERNELSLTGCSQISAWEEPVRSGYIKQEASDSCWQTQCKLFQFLFF